MKFTFGFLLGLLMGVLMLISALATGLGGIFVGWKIFGSDDTEYKRYKKYRTMSTDPRNQETTS